MTQQQQQRPTQLTDLSAIDERRAAALRDCGIETPEHVAAASVEQLQQVDRINRAQAGRIQHEVDHIDPHPDLDVTLSGDGDTRDTDTGRLWLARAVGVCVFAAALVTIPTQSAAAAGGGVVGGAAVAIGVTRMARRLL
jgi:hypothetical protein